MSIFFNVSAVLLWIYRERSGSPAFWAEPLNAITNASFLIAALLAWRFADRRRATTHTTLALVSLAVVIGSGSFYFHSVPNHFTMWLDIVPIALFQVFFLWLVSNRMLDLSRVSSTVIVVGVVGSSFALLPLHAPLNGSLFYFPSVLAMLTLGVLWVRKSSREPYLLVGAACVFALAIIARSVDWIVPWPFGSHFLWHLLNGVVVYMALRAWIVFVARNESMELSDTRPSGLRRSSDHRLATQE
ncbi:ceramidase [Aeoliella sp. ICT_H6.2]|uniref:Ceramidase n=1 Tax=Aeoliella straminimaris TaxID=2954799 RepID=A0A9X2JG13_9BACT|nr:ceramidase domain-containing protein [Aeoliella straminimaris]MCO6044246.1 ceramidase [Aeoliella straminimaris]